MNKVKQLSFARKEIFCGLDVHNIEANLYIASLVFASIEIIEYF